MRLTPYFYSTGFSVKFGRVELAGKLLPGNRLFQEAMWRRLDIWRVKLLDLKLLHPGNQRAHQID